MGKIWDAVIPPSVVMVLDLDDASVIRGFHADGIDFVTDTDTKKTHVGVSSKRAALAFIEELEYRGTEAWDSPFGVRMAMKKVAKRLRKEWAGLLGVTPLL